MSTPKGKPQARLQTEIPEQGVELLPIEAENPAPAAENSVILTEEIPEAAAVSNTRTSYVSDALPSAAVPTAAPAAVKASSIPVLPFGVAGGLLALGGFALAAKGSGSDGGKSDQAPNNSANQGNDNGNNPPPAEPVANHIRLVYGNDSQQIKPLDKWQDNVLHAGKKLTVADVPENNILAQYTQKHGASKVQSNIRQAYLPDSDGDGIIDHYDSNPDMWNVSDRDLREFSTLSYKNRGDWDEFEGKWTVLKQGAPGDGLNYSVFGNGKHADGSYDNIVVAFRGTEKTSPKDWYNDLQLMSGHLANQTKYLDNIANEVMAKYRPTNVYSTGHSLGGYLAQFFAVDSMAQSDAHKQAFKRSALFNPAVLKTDSDSPADLHKARSEADKFTQTPAPDRSDLSEEPKNNYKTHSYVITGEWVSAGFNDVANATIMGGSAATGAIAGAKIGSLFGPIGTVFGGLVGLWAGGKVGDKVSFEGLGSYPNSIFFDFKSGEAWGKHDLSSFYERDAKLQKYFSTGYRTDSHYQDADSDKDGLSYVAEKRIGLNPQQNNNQTDSDHDGFSDILELKLGCDFRSGSSIIDLKDYYSVKADEKVRFAIAGKETVTGDLIEALGVELSAQVQDNQLVYTPSGAPPLTLGINNAEWAQWLAHSKIIINGTQGGDTLAGVQDKAAVLYGAAGDDVLAAGSGLDVMAGGAGNDTFRFAADKLNRDGSADVISDFSAGDRLDLSGMRSLFADHGSGFQFGDILFDNTKHLFEKKSALVWNQSEQTLSYKTADSDTLHAFVRFDDEQNLAAVHAALIG
ncbi:M10 family metallopeptidase C-terminal domain-containing protein [Conchiformibius steedae]|uniref:DUF2974 domain-containing protein n=1 Tax=Conchiformibius steedae TaxID=153493 RepID=A0A3P2A661_9NEIS|nr:Mbeg1-like protein [Conchiformibius steedae]RRD90398.1 DUF2974 domain-containing protein [Conchiformibius steedae]